MKSSRGGVGLHYLSAHVFDVLQPITSCDHESLFVSCFKLNVSHHCLFGVHWCDIGYYTRNTHNSTMLGHNPLGNGLLYLLLIFSFCSLSTLWTPGIISPTPS